MAEWQLELYVIGDSYSSRNAIANLRRLCERALPSDYQLQIIDVLENPQAAEDANIIATPTLVRRSPLPPRRIVGDLSDSQTVLNGLDLVAEGTS